MILYFKKNYFQYVFAAVFLLVCFFIFAPFSFTNTVLALSGNYSRIVSSPTDLPLRLLDWNDLLNDFLARDGSNDMIGNLNMSNNYISNVLTPFDFEKHNIVNVDYIENRMNSVAGISGFYTNWGRRDCAANSNLIYRGYAFGSNVLTGRGGPSTIQCLQGDNLDPGSLTVNNELSRLFPIGASAFASSFSTTGGFDLKIADKKIGCALCDNYQGTCYVAWNTDNCAAGFDNGYKGWGIGGATDTTVRIEQDAYCVNRDFDSSLPNDDSMGGWMYGLSTSSVSDLPTTGYMSNLFIKCAVCCK